MSATVGNVAIVGAGWAGLAAAVTLVDAGVPVTVYEASDTLGGRARRVDKRGLTLDNGLHIMLGAYTSALRLIDKVTRGARVFDRVPLQLEMPGRFHIRAPKLPAPFHLLAALVQARGLSWSERRAAVSFMLRQRLNGFRHAHTESVATLLRTHKQPRRVCEFLWEPLCIAALNTAPSQADAQIFLNVLRDGLNAGSAASDLILPTTDLSALFAEPAAAYVQAHGGTIERNQYVRSIAADAHAFRVRTDTAENAHSHVICATDPARAPALLETFETLRDTCTHIRALQYSPITSIYLQYEDSVHLPFAMLALDGTPAQWVFDRGTLLSQRGLLGAVVSAASDYHGVEHDKLAHMTHEQLQRIMPTLATPKWHTVISEKRATFACTPGLLRPANHTPQPGLWLAGDYTASDYPGTLESAVRSGVICAEAILLTVSRRLG